MKLKAMSFGGTLISKSAFQIRRQSLKRFTDFHTHVKGSSSDTGIHFRITISTHGTAPEHAQVSPVPSHLDIVELAPNSPGALPINCED